MRIGWTLDAAFPLSRWEGRFRRHQVGAGRTSKATTRSAAAVNSFGSLLLTRPTALKSRTPVGHLGGEGGHDPSAELAVVDLV